MARLLYAELSDDELFAKMRQNDTLAFNAIYLKYWKELLDTAYRRLNSLEQAEEIVQDLFVNIYTKRSEIVITSSLRAYLHTAIKYKVLNEIRTGIVRNNYKRFSEQSPLIYEPDASERLNEKELENRLNHALNQLPEKCRIAFMMSREGNLSYKKIAEQLGVSVNTVEKHIGKALHIMRTNLQEYHLDLVFILASFLTLFRNL